MHTHCFRAFICVYVLSSSRLTCVTTIHSTDCTCPTCCRAVPSSSYYNQCAYGLYFAAMNYTVHAVMYSYYALAAVKIRLCKPQYVTALQVRGAAACSDGAAAERVAGGSAGTWLWLATMQQQRQS
jgi:GNS1/SUR4 family